MMRVAVFAYTRRGCATAGRIMDCCAGAQCRGYTVERMAGERFAPVLHPTEQFYGECFRWADVLIFVGACGIAVRAIAPHLRNKQTDPAVLCVDELGQFVIPLLSGHIGGANARANSLAEHLGAVPVITTATDGSGRFSVDAWAARQGFSIMDMVRAKLVSAAILEKDIPMACDFPVATDYPAGVVPGNSGDIGIYITVHKAEPFLQTLRLVPRILHLGIGCRRGTSAAHIRRAVNAVLEDNGLERSAVNCAASISLKADEQGLLAFCREEDLPAAFYTPEELLEVPGVFSRSPFVESVTGVDTVCERAALVGASKLLVKKTTIDGVTVAVAVEDLEVRFG